MALGAGYAYTNHEKRYHVGPIKIHTVLVASIPQSGNLKTGAQSQDQGPGTQAGTRDQNQDQGPFSLFYKRAHTLQKG